MITTFEHLKIEPYNVERIISIEVINKINEHSKMRLYAILKEDEKDKPIYDTGSGGQIELIKTGKENETIFKGLVESINIKHVQGVYYLFIESISNTAKMDIKIKSRSFQDNAMPYTTLFKEVTKEYPKADVIDTVTKGKTIGKFVMQYDETDWQFIKRLASHFNAVLIPYNKTENPKFFIGVPEGNCIGELTEFNYSIEKKVTQYLKDKENNSQLGDLDKVFYEVETENFYNVGDEIKYKDITLYIYAGVYKIEKSIISNTYKLATKKGLSQIKTFNERITGLSVEAKVIETKNDELKLHLCIDKDQDVGKAHYFKYSTIYTASGNSGWYCMPELGDTVFAYFPNKDEGEAIALSSIRKGNSKTDKTTNPDIKYLRTKYGKELKFAPDELLISCVDDDTYIKMTEKNGIEIYSKKPIKMHSKEDITFDSDKKIYLIADEEISLTCKSSLIKMDNNVTIQGKEVKNN